MLILRKIKKADDAAMKKIVQENLVARGLNIPGTAYFDPSLESLSSFYDSEPDKRAYFVLSDEDPDLCPEDEQAKSRVLGGAGFAECDFFPACAELQKLYIADEAKGKGLSHVLIEKAEEEARRLGYDRMYLETHKNLSLAMKIYEKHAYRLIPRPAAVVHGTMDHFYLKELDTRDNS